MTTLDGGRNSPRYCVEAGRQSSCGHFPFSKLGRLINPFVLFKHKVESGMVLTVYPYNYITQYFLYRSSRVSKFPLVEYLKVVVVDYAFP